MRNGCRNSIEPGPAGREKESNVPAIKLCIVGGGSTYTLPMLRSLTILAESPLKGSTVVIMDKRRDAGKLMADFARLLCRKNGFDLKIEDTTDLDKGLDGADFALTTFRTGSHASTGLDETVPMKYGILGQETTGPSGIFMAARAIPEAVKVAQTMEKCCPDAWMINYTNPTNFVCDGIRRRSGIKLIGLCDGVYAGMRLVVQLLGLPVEKPDVLDFQVAGVNHCTWALRIHHEGRDLYPELPELVRKFDASKLNHRYQHALKVYGHFGVMPGSAAYTRYYYNLRAVMEERSTEGFETLCDSLSHHAVHIEKELTRKLKEDEGTFGENIGDLSHGDQAIGVINAIANNTMEIQTVDVPNNGAVENLPLGSIVEVAAVTGAHGAYPLAMGPLPKQVYGIVRSVLDHQELAVDAALSGDKKKVMQAAMVHPVVRSLPDAEKTVEELFRVHAKWLPQFK